MKWNLFESCGHAGRPARVLEETYAQNGITSRGHVFLLGIGLRNDMLVAQLMSPHLLGVFLLNL